MVIFIPSDPMIGTDFTPPIWKIFLTGVELFYRAYAINRLGISYGSVRKIQLPQVVDPNIWWTQALVHDGGWRTLDWFGTFLLSDEDHWMYHADFGWIYVVSDDHGGLWLWKNKVSTGSGSPVHPLLFLDEFSRRLALSTPFGTGPDKSSGTTVDNKLLRLP